MKSLNLLFHSQVNQAIQGIEAKNTAPSENTVIIIINAACTCCVLGKQ